MKPPASPKRTKTKQEAINKLLLMDPIYPHDLSRSLKSYSNPFCNSGGRAKQKSQPEWDKETPGSGFMQQKLFQQRGLLVHFWYRKADWTRSTLQSPRVLRHAYRKGFKVPLCLHPYPSTLTLKPGALPEMDTTPRLSVPCSSCRSYLQVVAETATVDEIHKKHR